MERLELINALRRMKAETGSLVCLGCGYENGCSVKGCALIRAAAEELARLNSIMRNLAQEYSWLMMGEKGDDAPMNIQEAAAAEELEASRPVRRGRWEDCSSGWMCSNCSWTQIRESNYCPNCGADMRGGGM